MSRLMWLICLGFLFCNPILGSEKNDAQFVSRKLKQLAELLPLTELPPLDTIVEVPMLVEGKSVVLQYNDKKQVRHLGLSLFSEATKQMLDVNICNFLERFFLELLLQQDAASFERKLQEYHVTMYIDGQKIKATNVTSFQQVLKKMKMPVNFSMRQKGDQAEAVWLFSLHALSVTFPLYRELIDGMDKIESDDELFHQLQVAVLNDVHVKDEPVDVRYLINKGNGLYVEKGEVFLIPSLTANKYYVKKGKEYVPVFQKQYPEYSLNNLFLTYMNGEGKILQITHRKYGYFTPEISIPLLNFLMCFKKDFITVCHTGINKRGNLETIVVFNHKRLNYIHLLKVETDEKQLFAKSPILKADFYSNIPQHSIKSLLQ